MATEAEHKSGMRSKRQVAKEAAPRNRTLDDMQRFYMSLDLAELWQKFYVSIDASGRPKYKTSRQLAKEVAQNPKQLEFLVWLLGSDKAANAAQMQLLYSFAKPLDFDEKRNSGGWFTESALKAHAKDIAREMNALDALRTAGNEVTIHSLTRMEQLARRLDEEFGGRFFVEGLSLKNNLARAHHYVSLHQRILNMIEKAQDIYAKSHGINFSDMSGFERLLTAQAIALAAKSSVNQTAASNLLQKLAEMTLEKATEHKFPLPAEVTKVVTIEARKAQKNNVM